MVDMKKVLLVVIFILAVGIYPNKVKAYGECSEYGAMVMYESYSNSCKCMSGYVFSSKYGTTQCVSADSVCSDKYGYQSRYDSLSDSCECSYGYVFGKDSIGRTQCVSQEDMCRNQLGYASSYNSLYDQCECDYGYFIKNGQCVHGSNTCRATHGLYSSYNDSANRCECDSGYTLDDSSQCVEKQNNVYFTLKELNTDEKKAIIKSDYDYKYYLITYNSGCYSSSFRRYLNHQIVVNLGTDYYLDRWDKIVLQDDNETCDITQKEYADSGTTLILEEEPTYYYVPEPVVSVPTPTPVVKSPEIPKKVITPVVKKPENKNIIATTTTIKTEGGVSNVTASTSNTSTPVKTAKDSFFKKISVWFKGLFK